MTTERTRARRVVRDYLRRMEIRLQRAYDDPQPDGGKRILVERLWPRGLTRERAAVDAWIKDIAPSAELRKWYGHEPSRWSEFKKRYTAELKSNADAVDQLREEMDSDPLTFVFGSKETVRNSASVLKQFLQRSATP